MENDRPTLVARYARLKESQRLRLIGAAVLQGLSGVLPLVIRGVWKVGLEKAEGPATPSDGTDRSAADASR